MEKRYSSDDSRALLCAASSVVGAFSLAVIGRHVLFSKRSEHAIDRSKDDPSLVTISKEFSFHDDLLSMSIDKVYLFTFPPSNHIRNISPFSLKVESFLRLHNIPYEVISTFKFGPKGQIPYIRLNSKDDGVIIADSNFIIHFLSKKLGINQMEMNTLSSQEMAVAHAFTRMIEEHTTQIGFYYRYGLHMKQFCSAVIPFDWFKNAGPFTLKSWFFGKLWTYAMPWAFAQKIKYVSFGRHSDEEKWKISCQDIQSISDYLGEKLFIFGDEATTLDCTLFGHLAQFLYIPLDFPQKMYMRDNCHNVLKYVERFKDLYWKDWDKII